MVNAESAARILSVIAGSMITVTSLVFSTTLIALTLAATNIGPRLVERFMQDRVTQISLGIFIATFVYSLLVLRTVKGGEATPFTPHLSINLALVFAILSFGWLIYFINRISSSLQTDKVVAQTGADFVRAMADFAEQGQGISERCAHGNFEAEHLAGRTCRLEVAAGQAGYIRMVNVAALYDLARQHDLCIEMLREPGHFVLPTTPLARIYGTEDPGAEALAESVAENVLVGPTRSDAQDVELLIHMVVEVAARALSPGVNDFYSAIACVDHLCSGMSVVLRQDLPPNFFFDDRGTLRLALLPVSFESLADAAFNPIRQSAANNVPVSARLLETFAMLATCARTEEDRAVLSKHAALVTEAALAGASQEADRRDIGTRYARFQEANGADGAARTR